MGRGSRQLTSSSLDQLLDDEAVVVRPRWTVAPLPKFDPAALAAYGRQWLAQLDAEDNRSVMLPRAEDTLTDSRLLAGAAHHTSFCVSALREPLSCIRHGHIDSVMTRLPNGELLYVQRRGSQEPLLIQWQDAMGAAGRLEITAEDFDAWTPLTAPMFADDLTLKINDTDSSLDANSERILIYPKDGQDVRQINHSAQRLASSLAVMAADRQISSVDFCSDFGTMNSPGMDLTRYESRGEEVRVRMNPDMKLSVRFSIDMRFTPEMIAEVLSRRLR